MLLLGVRTLVAAELQLDLDKTIIEFGHYSKAALYGIDLKRRINDIDLTELKTNFGVMVDEQADVVNDARWPNKSVQLLTLKLYPRFTGTIKLPILRLGDIRSQSQSVLVISGVDTKRDSISEKVTLSASSVWQRQAVSIVVDIMTRDPFVSLQSETLNADGFDIIPISAQSKKVATQAKPVYHLSLGWVLIPLLDGSYTIELPAIHYRQFGQILRRYFLPKQTIKVKALPPYIPPTMPVGLIELSSTLNADGLFYPNELSMWDISVTGKNVSVAWLPTLSTDLKSTQDVKYYSAKRQYKTVIKGDKLQSSMVIHAPYKLLRNGRVRLPKLSVQYFDPVQEKIINIEYQAPSLYALNSTWRIIMIAFSLLGMVYPGRILFAKLKQAYRRNRLRRSAFTQLTLASTVSQLRYSLNQLAKAEGWSANMTLQNWQQHWQARFKVSDTFSVLMTRLSQACYGSEPLTDVATFRNALLKELN